MERVFLLLLIVVSCIHFCYAQDLCGGSFSCTDPKSICFDGSCVCQHGFYRHVDGENCTERVKANETCEENITSVYQCADYPVAFCNNGTCKCNDTHYVHNATCAKRLDAGSPCDSKSNATDQCVIYANCKSGICVCQSDHYSEGGICTTRKKVGEGCKPQIVDQNQCAENSYCYRGNCTCLKGYYEFNDTFCHESEKLNGSCDDLKNDKAQCADPFANCSHLLQKCVCDNDHYHNQVSDVCEDRLTAGVACNATATDGHQCVEYAHCSHFDGDSIKTSTCVCDHGFFVQDGQCSNTTVPTGHGPSLTHPSGSPLPPIDELLKEIG